MVVVDTKSKKATFTPEYWLMKHFSRYVQPGAKRLITLGNNYNLSAFENEDGSRVIVVFNPDETVRNMSVSLGCDGVMNLSLQPKSFNTLLITE